MISSIFPQERLHEAVGSNGFFGAVWDKASCHLHPLNYALGLADAAIKAGAIIYEHSRVCLLLRFSCCS
jgi:gamma-glutamylputrescine oxidase